MGAIDDLLGAAVAQAGATGAWWVGTEHLVLAMLADPTGPGRHLTDKAMPADPVRIRMVGDVPRPTANDGRQLRWALRLEQVAAEARHLQAQHGDDADLLLLALVSGPDATAGLGASLLRQLGVDVLALRRQLEAALPWRPLAQLVDEAGAEGDVGKRPMGGS